MNNYEGADGRYPAGACEFAAAGRPAAPEYCPCPADRPPAPQPDSAAAQANLHTDSTATAADTQTGSCQLSRIRSFLVCSGSGPSPAPPHCVIFICVTASPERIPLGAGPQY